MSGRKAWPKVGFKEIDCAVDADGILVLVLNRPSRLNAFTPRMCDDMIEAFRQASDDDDVRAVVVTGAGRAFCAGMDLGIGGNVFGLDEAKRPGLADLREHFDDDLAMAGVRDLGGRLALAILACLKPVAAAINGPAMGIGATMTLSMDFRLAADAATIGFVFQRLGIVPEGCSSAILPRLVGLQQALEWVYAAEPISAEEALAKGLLRSVHRNDQLLDDTVALMKRLTTDRSPLAMALTRQMMWRNEACGLVFAHQIESLAMHWLGRSDGKEGVAAFLEKRRPNFTERVPSDLPPHFRDWWSET